MRRWRRVEPEKRGSRVDRAIARLLYPERPTGQPRTREECSGVPRPCPYVSCRHNLNLEVTKSGAVRLLDAEPWDEAAHPSCALDVVQQHGAQTLDVVGFILGLTRERVRQVELVALRSLAERAPELREALSELERMSDERAAATEHLSPNR